jgi:hypothetical protein
VKEIYDFDIINNENGNLYFSYISFILKNKTFKKHITDCTNYSIYDLTNYLFLTIGRKDLYFIENTRKDVFRILNASENPVAQNVGGYLVSLDNTHCPIFVNYHKEDDISESQNMRIDL